MVSRAVFNGAGGDHPAVADDARSRAVRLQAVRRAWPWLGLATPVARFLMLLWTASLRLAS